MLAAGVGHRGEQRQGGIKLTYSYVETRLEGVEEWNYIPNVLEFFNR